MLTPADAAGRTLRVPSVVFGEALRSAGAKPKLIPAPQVLKQFQDGAIDGALFPYEVLPTLKLASGFPVTECAWAGSRVTSC